MFNSQQDSGSGGSFWRKRNDKVITYDMKKPNRDAFNRSGLEVSPQKSGPMQYSNRENKEEEVIVMKKNPYDRVDDQDWNQNRYAQEPRREQMLRAEPPGFLQSQE